MDIPFSSSRSISWPPGPRSATPESKADLFEDAFDSDDEDPQGDVTHRCLDAYAAAAGLPPGEPLSGQAKARAMATLHCLLEAVMGGCLNLEHALEASDSDDEGHTATKGPDPVTLEDIAAFPKAAWKALSGHMGGITTLVVPAMADPSPIIQGVAGLQALNHLVITLPDGCEQIDLGGLQPDDPEKLRIVLHGSVSDLTVLAPAGAHVQAMTTGVALHKSRVFYMDRSGQQQGTPRTLAGSIYQHTNEGISQELAAKVTLNGVGTLGDIAPTPLESPNGPIVCRTLSMLWLMERHNHHARKDAKGPGADGKADHAFSYAPLQSKQAIEQSVTSDTLREVEGVMIGCQATALYDTDNFGAMLGEQFKRMAPGDTHYFMASTPYHMLGIEMRVKDVPHAGTMRREYVVNLYDPNQTITHSRVMAHDPGWFDAHGLEHWMDQDRVREYFPGEPKIGTLVQWVPPEHRAGSHGTGERLETAVHVEPQSRQSARYMAAAVSRGGPATVTDACQRTLASDQTTDAMWRTLRGDNVKGRSALEMAFDRNQPANMAAWMRAVLAADEGVLPLDYKLNLLRGQRDSMSALAFAAKQDAGRDMQDVIYAYVREIAASGLALADKQALLNIGSEVARRELKTDPARLAAKMCAIYDADLPAAQTKALLSALRVTGDDLLKALMTEDDPLPGAGPAARALTNELQARQNTWMRRLGSASHESPPPDGKLELQVTSS
ncbi:MAG: ShET2/EspL2 family type III secretion system effector toxin [Ramlibacter sp.]